jgi:hypothetical protein
LRHLAEPLVVADCCSTAVRTLALRDDAVGHSRVSVKAGRAW